MMSKLRWADIGHSERPGVFTVDGREISVSPEHIRIWQERPDAAFDVIELKGPAGLSSYSLDIRPAQSDTEACVQGVRQNGVTGARKRR
jgi:hypothetical protein